MSRILLEKGVQKKFLLRVHEVNNLSWQKIAELCHVSERTLRAWRSEKYKINQESLSTLLKLPNSQIPKPMRILPEYWNIKSAAALGGIARYKKYGNPGTAYGRKLGGIKAQERFRLDPEYAQAVGIKMRKEIIYPGESEYLAEFIGILLGDGGVTKNQVRITFNRVTDTLYSKFIQNIIKKLFGISSSVIQKNSSKGDDVVVSARNLVEFLIKKGVKIGSKIRNNVDVPAWILSKREYKIACIRGLIDTDGSFYCYNHKVNNKFYFNFAMCFTNYSKALLDSAYNILTSLGFTPTRSRRRIYLHKNIDIIRYFAIINSHNPKHVEKYIRFKKLKD
jgi:hypothetical protein